MRRMRRHFNILGAFLYLLIPAMGFAAEETPVEKRDLVITPPPTPLPPLKYTPGKVANMSFYDGDWNALIDANGLRPCSDIQDRFKKNHWISNIGASCYTEARKELYSDFTRRVGDSEQLGVEHPYNVNTPFSQIQKDAMMRVTYRMFNDYYSDNAYMNTIISGRLSMDFSFTDIFSFTGSKGHVVQRPRYVLLNNEIKETWEQATNTPDLEKEKEELKNVSKAEKTYLARTYGWSQRPLSNFRLKVERVANVPALSSLNFRLEEAADFGFVDFSHLVAGQGYREMSAVAQLPYFEHAVGMEYARIADNPVYYYRYYIPGNVYSRVGYNSRDASIQFDFTKLM